MLKPLLRTIPNLSGNVKLCCSLIDFNKLSKDSYESNIRGAVLNPLSHTLYQKNINVSLLNSSYEYDLQKFYVAYSDNFFNSCFEYDNKDIMKLDRTSDMYLRNTDFEYGVKRVSYEKSGNQLAFFAPIYIDNINDIPDYFEIKLRLQTPYNIIDKNIRVNIGINKDSKYNYIYKYLSKYASNINDNVAYMDNDNKTVTYYGIDLINGGFTKKTDSTIKSLFDIKMPIQMFDRTLMEGFSFNQICMKQIIPLAFYFSPDDVLVDYEKELYKYATVKISGNYYKDGNKIDTYDFDFDYISCTHNIYQMNYMNGCMTDGKGYLDNLMSLGFPGFEEENILQYTFTNKISTSFCKWKLKYSTDEHPYITNMSWVYSKNQNSNYKYREFPTSFLAMSAYATVNNGNYDMRFPIGDDKLLYDKYNSRSDEKYKSIIDNYCLSWFDTVNDININDNNILEEFKNRILNNVEFTKVNDGYVYHKGILYNFNDIYNKIINFKEEDKIDYFSMIVNIDTTNIFSEEYIKENLKFASFNLADKTPLNVFYNKNVKNELLNVNPNTVNKNLSFNNVYKKKENIGDYLLYLQEHNNESSFIDASSIGIDLYKENSVVKVSDNIGLTMLSMLSVMNIDNLDSRKYFLDFYIDDAICYLFDKLNDYHTFINDSNYQVFKDIIYLQLINKNGNDLPFFFKPNYGYELYELLPVYKAQEYIDSNGRILKCFYRKYPVFINDNLHNKYGHLFKKEDIEQLGNNNVYINSSFNIFNPTKLDFTDNVDSINPINNLSNVIDTYYHSLYYKSYFVNSKTIPNSNDDAYVSDITNCIRKYITSAQDSTLNINEIKKEGSVTKTFSDNVSNLFNKILSVLNNLVSSENIKSKYLYYPYKDYMNNSIGKNIAYKINTNYNEYSNDLVYEKYSGKMDNNVLYVHPYNIISRDENNEIISSSLVNKGIFGSLENDVDKLINDFQSNENNFIKFYGKVLNTFHFTSLLNKNISSYRIIPDDILKHLYGDDVLYNENTFIKRFYKQYKVVYRNNIGYNEIKYLYELIEEPYEFYKTLSYDYEKNMFYTKKDDTIDLFNIVEKTAYIKMNKSIYDFTNIEGNIKDKQYQDMYVYRPILDIEFDDKYGNFYKMTFVENIDENCILEDTDSMLYHCFNEKHIQERNETVFYSNLILDNINSVTYVKNNNIDTETYYRYNQNNSMLYIELKNSDILNKLNNTLPFGFNLYDNLNNDSVVSVYSSNTNINEFNSNNINIVDIDGIRYGFYLLNIKLDNTYNSFNIYGMIDESSKFSNYENINQINLLKFINIINDRIISQDKKYLSDIFGQLCPFLNIDLFYYLDSISTVIKPTKFSLSELYKITKYNDDNNSKEQSLIFFPQSLYTVKKQILQRYTNSITPYIKKTYCIDNLFYLKLKEINASILETGKYRSIGDYCMYNRLSFIDKFENYNIYNDNSTLVTDTYKPLEIKYYNDNTYINLEKEFSHTLNKLYIYDEILKLQSEENTLDIFKKYILKYIPTLKNEEILFLYKKYKHTYNIEYQRVSIDNVNKLYKLTYKFTLY